jgi:hypothetical protein
MQSGDIERGVVKEDSDERPLMDDVFNPQVRLSATAAQYLFPYPPECRHIVQLVRLRLL